MAQLRGRLEQQVAMAHHVSWHAGGMASAAYWPADCDDLREFVRRQPADAALLLVGNGSNLLVRDGGFDGTVIFTAGLQKLQIELAPPAHGYRQVYAEAGVAATQLAKFAAANGLTGLEFLAGIPGTVGGCVAQNAGCFGSESWDCIDRVNMLNRRGELIQRSHAEFEVGYRRVEPLIEVGEWFAGAWFDLREADGSAAMRTVHEFIAKRRDSQPLDMPNAGRAFRNPQDNFAARLIQLAGMAGARLGGARVSERHPNFVINGGDASASDIERLIDLVAERVQEKFGVRLQCDVRIVGNKT
ncbi:MAG: UDP-N-acetylmuramate dehydrogenase [Chitinivorax sp.]